MRILFQPREKLVFVFEKHPLSVCAPKMKFWCASERKTKKRVGATKLIVVKAVGEGGEKERDEIITSRQREAGVKFLLHRSRCLSFSLARGKEVRGLCVPSKCEFDCDNNKNIQRGSRVRLHLCSLRLFVPLGSAAAIFDTGARHSRGIMLFAIE